MADAAYPGRLFVVRARRDTLVLVATATLVTFALASAIHSRPPVASALPSAAAPASVVPVHQSWAGDLDDRAVDAAAPAAARAPLTSASLVVPASDLALPKVSVRPLVRLNGCAGAPCPPLRNQATLRRPGRAMVVARAPFDERSFRSDPFLEGRAAPPRRQRHDLIARLNPFNHLPDVRHFARPFTYAGDAVGSWFRSF
jgi:hypothetical protein